MLLLVAACLTVSAQTVPASKPKQKSAKPSPVKPVPEPVPVQAPPPQPLTPEQSPPTPPQVTYQDGQLTIVAQNSTLKDILAAVRARTGAVIEAPPGSGSERVAARIGPAAPRNVLATLLNGSRFDYILLGSEQDANAVERIILTARSAAPNATPGQQAGSARPPVVEPNVPSEGDEDINDETPDAVPEPPVQPVQPPQPVPQPATVQPGQPQPGQTPQNPGQPKTPEQLLEELQRMQRERQQQQQQQPSTPPPEQPQQQPPAY